MHLVFLDDPAQVPQVKQLGLERQTRLVALTADCLQALEEANLPHAPVSKYANTRLLARADDQFNRDSFALAQEIERHIAERYPPARFDGPGFLSGQGYYIQYSVSAIAKRAFLLRETIRACSPDLVTVFDGKIDPWFSGDGYVREPWLDLVAQWGGDQKFRLELLQQSSNMALDYRGIHKRQSHYSTPLIRRGISMVLRKLRLALQRHPGFHGDLGGLRILMVGSRGYDWAPVLDILRAAEGADCFAIDSAHPDDRGWNDYYSPIVHDLKKRTKFAIAAGTPQAEENEAQEIANWFDDWRHSRSAPPQLNVLGMDLFPALAVQLRSAAMRGPALARQTDVFAAGALAFSQPHAVSFFAMPGLAAIRMAYQCRQRGIPVVCYQHGFGYGVQIQAKDEQTDPAHADYFLTYGAAIHPRPDAAFPVRAQYVPVGSARIEQMRAMGRTPSSKANARFNVLWIAESSTRNTLVTSLFEDTERYLLQKQCLTILGNAPRLRVTYRPYRHCMDYEGTTRYLESANLPSLQIDPIGFMADLIRSNDVVIMETTSPTTWAEVIGLGKPMILYCDPQQTLLVPAFTPDLERACYWCKSSAALIAACQRLTLEPESFLSELSRIETALFVRQYVLHRNNGKCAEDVVSFLDLVCRKQTSLKEWNNRQRAQE